MWILLLHYDDKNKNIFFYRCNSVWNGNWKFNALNCFFSFFRYLLPTMIAAITILICPFNIYFPHTRRRVFLSLIFNWHVWECLKKLNYLSTSMSLIFLGGKMLTNSRVKFHTEKHPWSVIEEKIVQKIFIFFMKFLFIAFSSGV